MRRLHYLVTVILLASCGGADGTGDIDPAPDAGITATSPPGEVVAVEYVFDGDSLEVKRTDGSVVEVRLLGINAPEGDECHGDSARKSLVGLLNEGGKMTLVTDDDGDEDDQFGRLLRYLYVDGTNVNLKLVETGAALPLQSGHRLEQFFVDAGEAAAAEGLGLWAAEACGNRPALPEIEIVDYEYDPSGRDADNANNEWVVIANQGDYSADLSDWTLRDESTQHRFRFPAGFSLPPDGEVKVRSGCGEPSSTELFWCATDPVWSNGGDTIILQQTDGAIVAWERYPGSF